MTKITQKVKYDDKIDAFYGVIRVYEDSHFLYQIKSEVYRTNASDAKEDCKRLSDDLMDKARGFAKVRHDAIESFDAEFLK